MAKFLYKAKNNKGDIVSGTVIAQNEYEAEQVLLQNKLSAMEILPERSISLGGIFKPKITPKDRAVFARQIATMISAGLTLTKAISIVANSARNDRLKELYYTIYKDLEEGSSFSGALAKHPEAFDRVFVSVVRSGETTGNLETVLDQSAENLENDNNLIAKIRGAMYYPGFIFSALVVVGIYMLIKVIPQLQELFMQSGAKLPWATRAIIWLSEFVQSKWYIAIAIIVALVIFLKSWAASANGARTLSLWQLKFPIVTKFSTGLYMTRFCQIMQMLVESGVPLLEALKIMSGSISNIILEEEINSMVVEVERGIPLSTPLTKSPYFPKLIGQMVSVGEQTGKLDQVLGKIAQYYEEETDNMIKSLASLIEPAILLVVGMGVALLVFAVLMPIYSIVQFQ